LGGDPDELRARYALRISVSLLRDPQYGEVELLERALAGAASLDARLHWALSRRLIGALLAERRIDEALSVYDEASRVVTFPELDREEIERYRLAGSNGQVEQNVETGSLLFRLEADASVTGELLVSPSLRMPVDLDYEAHALSPGSSVKVERREAITPQRWVFRDAAGSVRASGTIWPAADRTVEVEIAIREPSLEPAPAATPVLEPGDGRRRLFVVVLDCGDWRLIQYLRARRELPQIEALLAEGYRAVLESSPAFTGAAMEALVWPTQQPRVSLLGLLQRMGLELGALASVGRNPLGFLAAVLPQRDSLFEVVGAGERVAANLLFSHGGIDAGRHAELQGPNGERRQLEFSHYARPLREDEWEGFSDFDWAPPHRRHLETIAAEFDATREIIENGDTDLLLMRIEALDLVTHVFFRSLLQVDQDDGVNPLLDTYRYIDSRLAEIRAALDARRAASGGPSAAGDETDAGGEL
jgi:hypothetical protein